MPDGIRDLIGQQLQHYQITAILDIGGEYRYLRAIDTSNQRSVMLVILPPKIFEEQDAFAQLKEECVRIQSLKQTHLLPIYYAGMWKSMAFVVVPPIRESLSNYLAREKRIEANRATRTVADLSWAVQTLHNAGLIHGDIQPGNLLYDETGVLHLADFGITRALAREQDNLRRGHGRGTTAPLALPSPYKAPELIGPRIELSVGGDIYSLGAILYEVVTGVSPRTIQPDELIPLPAENGLDPQQRNALSAAIRRAMAQDPNSRYPDARTFAVALRSVSGSKTMPPVRNESLTSALAGVWHVSQGPASDASAQQLIASLFSVEEPEKARETHSRRAAGGMTASEQVRERKRFRSRLSMRWLIAVIAVVIVLVISIVGVITVVNGNPLQRNQATPTPLVAPTDTSTATYPVRQSPAS